MADEDFIPFTKAASEDADFIPFKKKEDEGMPFSEETIPGKIWRGAKAATLGVADTLPGALSFGAGMMGAGASVPLSLISGRDVGEEASKIMGEATSPEVFKPTTEAGKDFEHFFNYVLDKSKSGMEWLSDKEAEMFGLPADSPLRNVRKALAFAVPDLAMGAGMFHSGKGKAPVKPKVETDLFKGEAAKEAELNKPLPKKLQDAADIQAVEAQFAREAERATITRQNKHLDRETQGELGEVGETFIPFDEAAIDAQTPKFLGGREGGISRSTRLELDENGMPIDKKATREHNMDTPEAQERPWYDREYEEKQPSLFDFQEKPSLVPDDLTSMRRADAEGTGIEGGMRSVMEEREAAQFPPEAARTRGTGEPTSGLRKAEGIVEHGLPDASGRRDPFVGNLNEHSIADLLEAKKNTPEHLPDAIRTIMAETALTKAKVEGFTKRALDKGPGKSQSGAIKFTKEQLEAYQKAAQEKAGSLPSDTEYRMGDRVVGANGKLGTVRGIVGDELQLIYDDGSRDFTHKSGVLFKAELGRGPNTPSKMGGPGKKQGGAIDFNEFLKLFPSFKGTKIEKVMYHGTSKDKDFGNVKANTRGAWFTDKPEEASMYAKENDSMNFKYQDGKYEKVNTASRVHPVYLNVKNPYRLTDTERESYKYAKNYAQHQRDLISRLKREGYDALETPDGAVVVFDSAQIKSATSPLGGVGKKQGGALDLSAFFTPRAKKVAKKAESDNSLRIFSTDDRSIGEFMKDVPMPEADITRQRNLQTSSWRTTNPLLRNMADAGYKIYHYVNDQLKKVNALEHMLNMDGMQTYKDVYNHYGVPSGILRNPFKKADWERFRKDLKTVLDMEGGEGWFDGTNYTPTAKQMVERGMSPESAKVWEAVHRQNEKLWERLKEVSTWNGREIPDALRVPGWMPHVWKGPYRVLVKTKLEEFKAEYNYYSRKEQLIALEAARKHVAKEGLDWEVFKEDPEAANNTSGLLEDLYRVNDIMKNNEGMQKLTQIVYEAQAKGMITHALERQGGAKKGHLLERALETGDERFGLTHKEMLDAIQLPQRAAESINGWYIRGKLLRETVFPLLQSGYLDHPNLHKAVTDIVNNFIDIPNSVFKHEEGVLRSWLIDAGWNPGNANRAVRMIHGGLAKLLLMFNLPYYVVNTMQWMGTPFYLMSAATKMKNWGEQTPSVMAAMFKTAGDIPDILRLDPKSPQYKYAKERGYLDPVFTEHVDPTAFRDRIAEGIEKRTRYMTFMMGYHFFKQLDGFTEVNALEAASKAADAIGVPYNPQFGQPKAVREFAGELARPFALFSTYPIHMMGLMSHFIENNARMPAKAVVDGVKHVGAYSAAMLTMWGLSGVPLVSNINDLIKFINTSFGTNLRTTTQWAREMEPDKKLFTGAGEIGEVGLVSSLSRFDVHGSAQGVGIYNPFGLMTDLATTAIAGAVLTGNWFKEGHVTRKQAWEFARTLPHPILRRQAEYLIKEGGTEVLKQAMPEFMKQVLGVKDQDVKDYAPQKDINDKGDYLRDKLDTRLGLLGITSVNERKSQTSDTIFEREQANNNRRIEYLMQVLKEGGGDDTKRQTYFKQLLEEYHKSPDKVIGSIITFNMQKHLTDTEKMALKLNSIEAIKKYERRQEIKNDEPKRPY